MSDGSLKDVVMEVKPKKNMKVLKLNEGRMEVPANGLKKLRGFEYDLKMAHKTLKSGKL
jgi:hypothetical protein